MDLRENTDDVHQCTLCKNTHSDSYCDICHVSLCTNCIGEHISDGHDNHKIVLFKNQRKTLVFPKCLTHSNKTCKLRCEQCKKYMCEICIASKDQKGHTVRVIDDLVEKKKTDIKKDSEELQTVISQTYIDIAKDLQNEIDNLDEGYEKLATAISNKGKERHRNFEVVINKMKSEIIEMKKKHKEVLDKYLSEINKKNSHIQRDITALCQLEEYNVVSDIMAYVSGNKCFDKRPPRVHVSFPKFHPERIKVEHIYQMIGSLTPFNTSISYGISYISKKLQSLHRELIDLPKVIHRIPTEFKNVRSISFINKEQIWMSSISAGEIRCFDYDGVCRDRISTKSGEWPNDIAVAPDGNVVYSDGKLHNVNKVVDGQIDEIIKLRKWIPLNLCFIRSGDLLVVFIDHLGIRSKLVRYKQSIRKQTIQFDQECNPIYSGRKTVKYIVENRNNDICLADFDAGKVVVVNQAGKIRFRYSGNHRKSFKPFGIATNSQSQILTADGYNHCIHIVDKDGLFLRYIDDVRNPFGLCVDEYDDLFVTEYFTGNVKVIQYLMEIN